MAYKNDIHLMVAIFQRVLQFESHPEDDPEGYVKRHAPRIRKAGELLEYLGLAEADAKSPLGWKPTRSMMELIAYRLAKTKPKGTKVIGDDFISELLWHFAYQGSSGQGSELGRYTLHALGLLRENAEGELHATQQLQHIFENSFHLQA